MGGATIDDIMLQLVYKIRKFTSRKFYVRCNFFLRFHVSFNNLALTWKRDALFGRAARKNGIFSENSIP